MSWIFSNQIINNFSSGYKLDKCGNFNFYNSQSHKSKLIISNSLKIYIDGYIIPRLQIHEQYCHLSQQNLIKTLYLEFGVDFIKKIKGSFIIIIFEKEVVQIFNDSHSFRKFFYSNFDGKIFVSSELSSITDNVESNIDKEALALYSLMEHNVNGLTFWKNIFFSLPGTHLTINLEINELKRDSYFNPLELIKGTNRKQFIKDLALKWDQIIQNYINYLKPTDISLTITGGNDSRVILASLLKNKVKVNLFSFGNPTSFDGVIAQEIADSTKLAYNNYFVREPNVEWFRNYSEKILNFGNTMVNVHRAHRLNAIEDELINHPEVEMLFCGFMGGDYVKGLIYDDYITPRILRLLNSEKGEIDVREIIIRELNRCHINSDEIAIERIVELVKGLPFIENTELKVREFLTLFYLVGSIHDMQDTTVFGSRIEYIVNPFMDIDFLELLYNSRFSYLSENNNFLWKVLRYNRSTFHLKITDILAPELSKIRYAKKGHYTAKEYLNNNPLYLFLKRINRLKQDQQYPQNFPYGIWMSEYCSNELNRIDEATSEIYQIPQLKKVLSDLKDIPTTEGFWHLFTNPINISLNIKKLKSKNNETCNS